MNARVRLASAVGLLAADQVCMSHDQQNLLIAAAGFGVVCLLVAILALYQRAGRHRRK